MQSLRSRMSVGDTSILQVLSMKLGPSKRLNILTTLMRMFTSSKISDSLIF